MDSKESFSVLYTNEKPLLGVPFPLAKRQENVAQIAQVDESDTDQMDRKLIELVVNERDKLAMERLYNAYRQRLGRFLRRYTRDVDLIEEVFNDVMLTVWEKAHQYKGGSKVSTWVFTIACRRCMRLLKRQQFREKVESLFEDNQSLEQELEAPTSSDSSDERLDSAIAQLSVKHRMVIELCYFQNYSTKEASEILSCSQNTVKTRLHYSRKKIRAYLDAK